MSNGTAQPFDAGSYESAHFDLDDDFVVVGSGAGGGTLAAELTRQGVKFVLLETGPLLRNADYLNDEWPAFNQMAWLDPSTTHGFIDGASVLDWPITLDELAPYYDLAECKLGSTHRHGLPPLPGNNNYTVLANGAARLDYRHFATGSYETNAEPQDGRPGSIQDCFNFQGEKNGSKWSTLVAETHKAAKTGKLDLRPKSQWICARKAR